MLSRIALVVASALTLISTSSASALIGKRWDTPLPSCTDFTPFVYAGCFNDPSTPSALIFRAVTLDGQSMTVNTCVSFCKGNGYRYAGLEYYGECFCGATVNGVQIDESNCNYPCTGNSSEVCGGTDIISVYQDPTFLPVDDTIITDYKPLGCYSDLGPDGRTLAWQQTVDATALTVETCLTACKQEGYPFAGVEYAQECWCGVVLGNDTVPLDSSQCNMPCTGNAAESCGGSGTLDLYVATDLESLQPCGYVPPPVSTTTTSSTTSSTTTPPSTTPPSLCTSTVTVTPIPTCEYKCGKWCSKPLPPFSDGGSCKTAVTNCLVQTTSCFLQAGWPDSLNCFEYSSWCSNINSYCSSSCPGSKCSLPSCKSKYPPSGSSYPSASVSTSVYTCPPSTTTKPTSTKPTTTSTSTSCIPIPTTSCICSQPHNPANGYTSTSPVGGISLPCLTCNNIYSDYKSGNWFKLYNAPDSKNCPSYPKPSVTSGCKTSCDNQYSACINTYAESCRDGSPESYDSASTKCKNQWKDCYSCNSGASGGNRCGSWNSGWY